MRKLIKEICKQEGKKHQASVGDVREILRILAYATLENDLFCDEWVAYLLKAHKKINLKRQKLTLKEISRITKVRAKK